MEPHTYREQRARGDGRRSRLARAALLTLALAAVAALGLLASACGGSAGEGVAQVDSNETTTTAAEPSDGASSADPAAYSACMRENGVPEFPDPDSEGRIRVRGDSGIDPESAQFESAARACQTLAPENPSPAQQAEFREQLLGFSACMRENGIPMFPDPAFNPDGSGGISIDSNSGIDEDSPQFRDAEKTCEKRFPADPGSQGSEGGTP